MKKITLATMALMASLTWSSGTAQAGTVVYDASTFALKTDFSHTSMLPLWDPTLFPGQTLISAQIFLRLAEDPGTITITSNASTEQTFQFTFSSIESTSGGVVSADRPNLPGLALYGPQMMTLGANTLPANNCSGPLPGPGTTCTSYSANPGPQDSGYIAGTLDSIAANLLLYTGSGNFGVGVTTFTNTSFSGGGGNLALTQTNIGTYDARVVYTYQDSGAPEPATLTLFGSALIGLGVIGRKRLARS